jgi:RHS repeat-associated protein
LSITNIYDQFLRRTNLGALSAASQLVAANYSYDNSSRLQSVNDGSGNTANYNYLANSPLLSQVTFARSGTTRMTTTKQYDFLNRLTRISSLSSAAYVPPLTYNYNYNPANQRTMDTLADGSYWVYGYDSLGQVTNGCKYFADGTAVAGQQFGYTFDTIGNRTQTLSVGDNNGANLRVANYWANSLNQVTNRDVPPVVDIMGASCLTNAVSVNGQMAYRKQEYYRQQLAVNNTNSALWTNIVVIGGQSMTGNVYVAQEPEHFLYDADGNLTNDGRWSYTWDAENRLVQMSVNSSVGPLYRLMFAYDGKGRRIQKKVVNNSVPVYTNNFLYDGWNLVAETTPTGLRIRTYVWGSDLSGSIQGAGGVGGLLEVTYYGTGTTNCFPAFDGNGNLAALVNATDGTLLANYEYGPFGEVIRSTGPMAKANPFRFSTKYQDDESDLLYYGYRYYKPSTGAWLGKDPIEEEGGENLYAFVANDPISQIDYLGFGDPSLSGKDGGVQAGKCGNFNWKYFFLVSGNSDGKYIVQNVNWSVSVSDSNGPLSVNQISQHLGWPIDQDSNYFEMWPARTTTGTDVWTFGAWPNTKGTVSLTGTASYFPRRNVPYGFGQYTPTPASSLWWTTYTYGLTNGHGVVTRSLTATWDCTCTSTDQTTKVSTTVQTNSSATVNLTPQ